MLVRFVKGETDAALRLQVPDIDGPAPAHKGAVIQGGPGPGCRLGQSPQLLAGSTHSNGQRQPQIRACQGADPAQHLDQVVNGKPLLKSGDQSRSIVI